jgi:hypothetical protein
MKLNEFKVIHLRSHILLFIIILSGCTSVTIIPSQDSGYYAVGESTLIKDAIICQPNRPAYASAIGLELQKYELIQHPARVPKANPAKGCEIFKMNYLAAISKGEYIIIEEFRIFDAAFPMAYPNLHAIGKYKEQSGNVINFYYRLGAAKFPNKLIWN